MCRPGRPARNHIVVSKTNRVLALMDGAETLKRYEVHLGFPPQGHKLSPATAARPRAATTSTGATRAATSSSASASATRTRSTSRARGRSGVRPGRRHLHPRRPAPHVADRRKKDWTAGCIAVSDAEMEEIWSMVPTGIPITILA